MRRAEILDAQEDKRCGMWKLGFDLPDELLRHQDYLALFRQACKEMVSGHRRSDGAAATGVGT